ncbi:hypothetical protein FC56_GL001192 [Lentilactobacillus senioris DSM 24302 = JCM 17472]|uniref:DUF3290 domain-containing protein n=1 Tax=Lentilactobacillus senioris DSM 24302 = JCM 17472 TaxID=1423802 RepID=A0A0R2CSN8_9LACO|nr:DUF3290 domain-containing protein [Lentilactobacillus senioris]KRM94240.1 hypothetical protein FC56_GL001192 [Lentilactobacillus senioris DSM 24302 = JCM 17472]
MDFYTYQYLQNNQNNWQYVHIGVIIILVILFIAFGIRYLKNRWDVKYKDLTIIVGVLCLLIVGIQANDYTNLRNSIKQTGQVTQIVQQVATKLKVKPQRVLINATQLNNTTNLLVKTPKGYFRLLFSEDGTQFVLEKIQLSHPEIKIQED